MFWAFANKPQALATTIHSYRVRRGANGVPHADRTPGGPISTAHHGYGIAVTPTDGGKWKTQTTTTDLQNKIATQ